MRRLRQVPPFSSPTLMRLLSALLCVTIMIAALLWMRAPRALAYSINGVPVIYVHGYADNGIPGGCNGSTNFGTIRSFLTSNGWTGPLYSVKYYNGDQNCDFDLHVEQYTYGHCTGWYAGNEGTTNEDIRHITCLLAWYLWDNFTAHGVAVKVIAHSMGGIIIRQMLFDTPYISAFPAYITVEDVVTAGTPHQGFLPGTAWARCGSCTQVGQLEQHNPLMQNLNSSTFRGGFGLEPNGYPETTDWTTMASNNDESLYWGCDSVIYTFNNGDLSNTVMCGFMPRVPHLVDFWSPGYNHGGYLTDNSTSWDAGASYSDNNGGTWYTSNSYPHSIQNMQYAISYLYW
jgi:hypothetical protein